MLLTFSRHQMMYNVSCVVSCVQVTYKRYFARPRIISNIASDLCFISEFFSNNFYSLFLILSALCVALTYKLAHNV